MRGRAVHVDPIKPTLKAPGIERLKLIRDDSLSNLAFKFNFRCYTAVECDETACDAAGLQAGAHTRSHFSSS